MCFRSAFWGPRVRPGVVVPGTAGTVVGSAPDMVVIWKSGVLCALRGVLATDGRPRRVGEMGSACCSDIVDSVGVRVAHDVGVPEGSQLPCGDVISACVDCGSTNSAWGAAELMACMLSGANVPVRWLSAPGSVCGVYPIADRACTCCIMYGSAHPRITTGAVRA